MAKALEASGATKIDRPLARRIFGVFTPVLNRLVTRIAGRRYVPLYVLLRHRFLGVVVRCFQEKPLFYAPRGQPLRDAEEVRLRTPDGLTEIVRS